MDDIEKKARELLRDAGEESPGCALVDGDAAIRAIAAALRAAPEQRAAPAEQHGAGDARAQFEAWAAGRGWNLSPRQNNCGIVVEGAYGHPGVQRCWEAWQAALAARPPAGQAVPEDVRRDVATEVAAAMREYLDQDVEPDFDVIERWADRLAAQPQGEEVGRG